MAWEIVSTDPDVKRFKVYQGWLVQTNGPTGEVLYIPDASFAWTLTTPPVVTPPVVTPPVVVPPVVVPPTVPTTRAKTLGSNLDGLTDYSTQRPFNDMMKTSRTWISQPTDGSTWDDGRAIALDSNGWPTSLLPGQSAVALMAWEAGTSVWPEGSYTLTYDGKGTITFKGGMTIASQSNQKMLLSFKIAGGGVQMNITATDPTDPIRNIKIVPTDVANSSEIFSPEFIALLKNTNTIRFMDWQQTNSFSDYRGVQTLSKWSDRTPLNYRTYTKRSGAPLEVMIDLCNKTKANAWFCIPHLATIDFCTQMATLIKSRLDPDLKVYIEYSNECWNPQFEQSTWCAAQGKAQVLSTNAFEAQLRFYSKQATACLDAFKAVFGTDTRLVRVLAGQGANSWVGTTILDFNSASSKCEAYAIAPYFGGDLGQPGTAATVQNYTVDQVIAALSTDIAKQKTVISDNKKVTDTRKLRLIAYEGGQHLVGIGGAENNTKLTQLFLDTNKSAKMGALYTEYLAAWKLINPDLFCHFVLVGDWTKWGSWGAARSMKDLTSPKLLALQAYMKTDV